MRTSDGIDHITDDCKEWTTFPAEIVDLPTSTIFKLLRVEPGYILYEALPRVP